MNEFANITDLQAIKVFFYVESVILVMAFGIIAFFLRRKDTQSIEREIASTKATEGLTIAVNDLKLVVTSLQIQFEIKQPILESQIEAFKQSFIISAEVVKGIDTRLVKLETEHSFMSCRHQGNKITINNE